MQQPFDIARSSLIVAKLEATDTVKNFDCGDEPTRLLYFDLNDLDED